MCEGATALLASLSHASDNHQGERYKVTKATSVLEAANKWEEKSGWTCERGAGVNLPLLNVAFFRHANNILRSVFRLGSL